MRKLIVNVKSSQVEINLDSFYEEDHTWDTKEEMFDELYDGFIHEIIAQSSYEWVVIDE